jgi:hypothetical protein
MLMQKGGNVVVSDSQFAFLRSIDTPTVCNLIEIVAPERRGAGYTAVHLHCPFPDLPPMVGFAKTVTIRARDKVSGPSYMQKRMEYLDYVAAAPRPSVVVIEDKDEPPGYGASCDGSRHGGHERRSHSRRPPRRRRRAGRSDRCHASGA